MRVGKVAPTLNEFVARILKELLKIKEKPCWAKKPCLYMTNLSSVKSLNQ
jgi:hypothetical protein